MSALSQRVAKLEGGQNPAVHRPAGITSDELLSLIFRTIAEVPVVANAAAYDAAVEAAIGPWVRALTPDEAKSIIEAIDAVEAERRGG
jgi:hypothetical protein